MTHFEYLSVAMSIVLSFAVIRLLDALPHAAAREKRYLIHALWMGFLLLWSAVFWWLSWSLSTRVSEFDFPSFLLLVTSPGLLYLCATALVSHSPADVSSWRAHFWTVRRRFFGFAIALVLSLVLNSIVLQGIPSVHPFRVGQVILFGLFLTGFLSEDERTHGVIAALAAAAGIGLVVLSLAGLFELSFRQE
jgi:hypothetical protein